MEDRFTEWQTVLTIQIRDIEKRHQSIHDNCLEWGRWAREWTIDRIGVARLGIWSLPGDYDPGIDPDAVTESPLAPIDERMVLKLDGRISHADFPTIWRGILKVNYIGLPCKGAGLVVPPEWQRPNAAKHSEETYRIQLGRALRYLGD